MGKRGRKPKIYPLPQNGLKYIKIPFDENFIFYEDGSMYSRRSGKFMTSFYYNNNPNAAFYTLFDRNLGHTVSFSVRINLRRYFFGTLPQIEGVEHKPIKGYEDLYQFYSNGKVWSKTSLKFLVSIKKSNSQFVSIIKEGQKPYTFYIHKELENYFQKGK